MVIVHDAAEFCDQCKKTKFISGQGNPIARISGARDKSYTQEELRHKNRNLHLLERSVHEFLIVFLINQLQLTLS